MLLPWVWRAAADGRGVIFVGVEGRVEVDEVDAGAVDAAHDRQVVAGPNGAAGEVGGGHGRLLIAQIEETRLRSRPFFRTIVSRQLLFSIGDLSRYEHKLELHCARSEVRGLLHHH